MLVPNEFWQGLVDKAMKGFDPSQLIDEAKKGDKPASRSGQRARAHEGLQPQPTTRSPPASPVAVSGLATTQPDTKIPINQSLDVRPRTTSWTSGEPSNTRGQKTKSRTFGNHRQRQFQCRGRQTERSYSSS